MKKFLFILNLLLLILWMGVIFNYSSDNGKTSSTKSERLIIKTVEFFKKEKLTEEERIDLLNRYSKPIRKLAHMTCYFILAVLAFFLLHQLYGLEPKTIIYTIIFCIIYAITDEIHQLFVPDRSGEILDVIIDTTGAILSLIIPTIVLIKKKKLLKK
jgi:VanZ family protein